MTACLRIQLDLLCGYRLGLAYLFVFDRLSGQFNLTTNQVSMVRLFDTSGFSPFDEAVTGVNEVYCERR